MTKGVTADDLLSQARWAQRLARCLVHDDADADDLLQDTWIAAIEAKPHSGPLRPWLRKVLRNRAYNRTRDDRRRDNRHHSAAAEDGITTAPAPDDLLARMQLQRMRAEEVCALAEPLRQTILLRFYEGLTSADIARTLGIPVGTVRWRLKTALDQLRDRLDTRNGTRAAWLPLLTPLFRPAADVPGTAAVLAQAASGGARMGLVVLLVLVLLGTTWLLWLNLRPGRILVLQDLSAPVIHMNRTAFALTGFLACFAVCAGESKNGDGSQAQCTWPAAFDHAAAGQCRAARAYLNCRGSDGVTMGCLSNEPTQCPTNPRPDAPCENQCQPGEYALACGSLGPGNGTQPPAACSKTFPTPGGVVFACCPCGS